MDTNDSLRVASLWHSMHAISQQLSPIAGCSGVELLEADTFDLHCFQSLTGTFFLPVFCLLFLPQTHGFCLTFCDSIDKQLSESQSGKAQLKF